MADINFDAESEAAFDQILLEWSKFFTGTSPRVLADALTQMAAAEGNNLTPKIRAQIIIIAIGCAGLQRRVVMDKLAQPEYAACALILNRYFSVGTGAKQSLNYAALSLMGHIFTLLGNLATNVEPNAVSNGLIQQLRDRMDDRSVWHLMNSPAAVEAMKTRTQIRIWGEKTAKFPVDTIFNHDVTVVAPFRGFCRNVILFSPCFRTARLEGAAPVWALETGQ